MPSWLSHDSLFPTLTNLVGRLAVFGEQELSFDHLASFDSLTNQALDESPQTYWKALRAFPPPWVLQRERHNDTKRVELRVRQRGKTRLSSDSRDAVIPEQSIYADNYTYHAKKMQYLSSFAIDRRSRTLRIVKWLVMKQEWWTRIATPSLTETCERLVL